MPKPVAKLARIERADLTRLTQEAGIRLLEAAETQRMFDVTFRLEDESGLASIFTVMLDGRHLADDEIVPAARNKMLGMFEGT